MVPICPQRKGATISRSLPVPHCCGAIMVVISYVWSAVTGLAELSTARFATGKPTHSLPFSGTDRGLAIRS